MQPWVVAGWRDVVHGLGLCRALLVNLGKFEFFQKKKKRGKHGELAATI